ncbi:MAG TPA: FAD-dependent oxidoreductase [Candidatus Binatia bacterium]|jgi:protoporphyrinogen oxidase
MDNDTIVVIGAGPAGLSAAHEAVKLQRHAIVLEKRDKVGGLARTENYRGYSLDIGGHRFFTKVEEVNRLWRRILGQEFLRRPRLSRIYYNRRFFYYPLRPLNALIGLGFWSSLRIVASYVRWQLFPHSREETFEQWVTNRFGKRLFRTFFKTYTEKVWGISCAELRAEWAAQRIRGLSLKTALVSMFLTPKKTIKTLIEEFEYPRLGPGMMWQAVKEEVERQGSQVRLNCEVVGIRRSGKRIESLTLSNRGHDEVVQGAVFVSSMPLREFFQKLDPPPPAIVAQAAERLQYRDLIVVCLIVRKPDLFPDNWIYIHDPTVKVGRIQNYKNWSPDMVPDGAKTSLGLEYFCSRGDALWSMADSALVELGKQEVARIGLAEIADIEDGCVLRASEAYPVYDAEYRAHLALVREFIDGLENFHTIGRNGLHRYNNQDHAMLTGMLAARNLILGEHHDLWKVNTEPEYQEEALVEGDAVLRALEQALARVFTKLDRTALGLSLGTVSAVVLFAATLLVVVKGGDVVGPNLQLLRHYFPGYAVTFSGSFVGLAYGFGSGFIGGWIFAALRNAALFLYLARIHRKAQRRLLRRFFDYL